MQTKSSRASKINPSLPGGTCRVAPQKRAPSLGQAFMIYASEWNIFLLLAEPHLTILPSAKHVLGGTRIQHQKMCHFSEPRGPSNGHGPGQGGRENATKKLGYFQFERGMCSTWAHSSRWLGKWVEKVNRYV